MQIAGTGQVLGLQSESLALLVMSILGPMILTPVLILQLAFRVCMDECFPVLSL